MHKICLVEDHIDLQKIVQLSLGDYFQFFTAGNLKDAAALLQKQKVDLILLDVNLPDGTGFDFCVQLKNSLSTKDIPVIFLSGKNEPVDQVRGFALGAEDYVTKPFNTVELKARIEARIRQSQIKSPMAAIQTIGNFIFDREKQKAYTLKDGTKSDLNFTTFEYRLFYFLASNEGQVFNRTKLLQHVMDTNVHVNDETIYTHISSLRKKLGEFADVLECIPRVGYCYKSN